MALHLCARRSTVAELMALCHGHVRQLLPLRRTPRHRIWRGFTTSSRWCFRRPDTSFSTNASPRHTEQGAHWVMSGICQSDKCQLPLTVFLSQKAILCCSRHSTIIMFIWKHFQCVSENTVSVYFSPLPPFLPYLFASCHQCGVPACDMFWLQMQSLSSYWRARTEKLASLSSSAAIGLCPHDFHCWAMWSCSGRLLSYEHSTFFLSCSKWNGMYMFLWFLWKLKYSGIK